MQLDISGRALVVTISSCLYFVSVPSSLLAAQEDAASISGCQAIEDDSARLACYDGMATTTAPPAADAPAAKKEPSPADPPLAEPAAAPAAAAPAPEAAVRPDEPGVAAASDETAAAAAASAGGAVVLSDEIGRETVRGRNSDEDDVSVRGRLVDCQSGRSGRYVFYFQNGQVWRQKDNKRLSWKDCQFEVTISKDFFGYRMLRDNDDRTVRIERVQ